MNPLTIVEYDVDIADVVDLTSEQERRRLDVPMDALACGWLADHARGRVPLSWAIADRLSSVFAGMLVKSFAPDASDHDVNLVLWHWNDHHGTVQPFDPEGRLSNEPWLR